MVLVDGVPHCVKDLCLLFHSSKLRDDNVSMSTASEDEIYQPLNGNDESHHLDNDCTHLEVDDNNLANDKQSGSNVQDQQMHRRK